MILLHIPYRSIQLAKIFPLNPPCKTNCNCIFCSDKEAEAVADAFVYSHDFCSLRIISYWIRFVYLRDFCSGLKFCVSFSFVKSQHGGCQDKAEITFAIPSTTKVSFQRQQRVVKKAIKQGKSSSEDRVGHFCRGHFGHRDRLDIIP